MKAKVKIETEIDAITLVMEIAVRYGEEDIPKDFPLRDGDIWKAEIDIDSHWIMNWPSGESGRLQMKVCDEGTYEILDASNQCLAIIENDYVPNSLLPGEYGDYIDLVINEQGIITNWKSDANLSDFFNDD